MVAARSEAEVRHALASATRAIPALILSIAASQPGGAQPGAEVPQAALAGSASKLVPIVLDLTARSEHFTTELTLANRGTTAAAVQLTYTPATSLGASGGGTAGLSLSPGQQFVVSDALAFLRSQGLPIPTPSASQGGTLLVSFTGLSSSMPPSSAPGRRPPPEPEEPASPTRASISPRPPRAPPTSTAFAARLRIARTWRW